MVHVFTVLVLFGMMAGLTYVPGAEATKMTAAVGFVLLAAFSIGELVKRAGLPSLLGYIIAGILFGPSMAELLLGSEGAVTQLIRQWYGTETVIWLFGADQAATLLPSSITEGGLGYVETLTVGVIGTLGGGELILDDLKDQIGTIIAVCAAFFLMIVPVTAAAVYGLTVYTPSLVPFLQGAPTTTVLGVALLFGVFGFAMSPAATLAIIQETGSKGRFTSLVLGIVIVADVVLVASFLITQAFAGILIQEGTLALDPVLAALPGIGAEFGWALVVGTVTGLVFIAYFRFVAREMLFFTVGAIFVASFVCNVVHAEKLLAFLTAGFLVQNLSHHGHDMIEALESISMPVFVVYFTIKAAELNLQGVTAYLALVGILTVIRTATLYGGVNLIARYFQTDLPDKVQDNLWLSFFSRGGVDLVLASLLAQRASQLGDWAVAFQNVIMGIVAIHLVAGPALLKFALDRTGESASGDPQEPEPKPEEESDRPDVEAFVDDPFPKPDFASTRLQTRVGSLREELVSLHETQFVRPIEQHDRAVRQFVDQVNEQIHEATDDLIEIIRADDDSELRADRIRERHKRFRQSLQSQLDLINELRPAPVTDESAEQVLDALRDMEPFESLYRVEIEPHLLKTNPGDGPSTRIIKWTRKAYSALFGTKSRTVPLGRLWRFYIELSLPSYLVDASAETADTHEEFWWQFGAQLRQVDQLFQRSIQLFSTSADDADATASATQTLPVAPSPDAAPFRQAPILEDIFEEIFGAETEDENPDADETPPEADAAEELSAETLKLQLIEAVGAVRDALSSEAERLRQLRTEYTQQSLESMTRALQRAYNEFLTGAEQAGTIQLPAFRYRPSIKFDQAESAERELNRQLRAQQQLITGFRGWMVADQQIILFLHWIADYEERVVGTLDESIRQDCLRALRNLQSRCQERPSILTDSEAGTDSDSPDSPPEADWQSWLNEQLRPSLERTRDTLSDALGHLGEGEATQRLLDVLETRVARLPDEVAMLGSAPNVPTRITAPKAVDIVDVPVEEWFMAELIRETALRYVEFSERAERSIRRSLVALQDVEQILDYNLDPGERKANGGNDSPERTDQSANEIAEAGLARAAERIGSLSDSLRRDEQELRGWICEELNDIACSTTRPFLDGDIHQIPDRLERRLTDVDEKPSERLLPASLRSVTDGIASVWHRSRPVIDEFTTDIKHRLTAYSEPVSNDDVRARLQAIDTSNLDDIPVVYRRLFTPVPIDIPDFYVDREELEKHCLNCIGRWFKGHSEMLLLYGDRGTGKRTLLHHLLPVELFNRREIHEDQISYLRLGRTIQSTDDFCRRMSWLNGVSMTSSLSSLRRQLRSLERKRIIVIEDGENLVSRTASGMRLGRTILDFLDATADDVLWIVTMGQAAVTLYDTLLDLRAYFTQTHEIGPIGQDQLVDMIRSRHRVSGFNLDFRRPSFPLFEKMRHPIATSEAQRHPRRQFFGQLADLSRGNPMLGLLYWLQSVRPDPDDDTQFLVEPLPSREIDLLEPLSRAQLLLVATLVQHRRLSVELLAQILQLPAPRVSTELSHLRRLGFVRQTAEQRTIWELRPFAEALTTPMLRENNLV